MLKNKFSEIEAELVFVKTKGDIHVELPPTMIGSKGIFEKEVNLAVSRGSADVAVHSLKDVPSEVSEDLVLAAVLPRESPLEVLVSRGNMKLEELPEGAVIGTSSMRRRAALSCLRPDLKVKHLRGNVDTRIRKLKEEMYDAILVAEAGLRRLELENFITQIFLPEEITPAPCQGAIGIYARKDDNEILNMLREVDDREARAEVTVEREITKRVGGGCFMPLGVLARMAGSRIMVTASLYSPTGRGKITVSLEGNASKREKIVKETSERLFSEGKNILSEIKGAFNDNR
jgi:hydroxymethylbilane synthase